MTLNKKKSAIMFISTKNMQLNKWETNTHNILKIPIVTDYKYLDITLNKKLKPQAHLEKLDSKM